MPYNPDCRIGLEGCECGKGPLVTRETIPSTVESVGNLNVIANKLQPRELRCLTRIANRLLMGQQAYGPLAPGKKEWKREAKEEAMDMAVYLSALLEDDDG